MPDAAKRCVHCEAEAEPEPTQDDMDAVLGLLATMSPDIIDEIRDIANSSESGEDFVNQIMIGDCPTCSSSKTGDCENDPEIDDVCIARCFACGQLWCADCGELFKGKDAPVHDCPAWDDEDDDFDDD